MDDRHPLDDDATAPPGAADAPSPLIRERLEATAVDVAAQLERRLIASDLRPATRDFVARELVQLRDLPPGSATAERVASWVDWVLGLPWSSATTPRGGIDLDRIVERLRESHAGCDEVVGRLLESLAATALGGTSRGDALLFVGPPGTGKSSLARALARALDRPFVTLPTGAMTDDSQLTGIGHRQDGAFPGAILEGLRRVGRPDAVLLFDELDKLQLGGGGDAGGPLLELLDPEQRGEFMDHYLGLPFDLSRCLIIATANDEEEMPEALVDRFDVVEFWGYTESAKVAIAERHLLPRARERAGVEPAALRLTPAALRTILREHTEEAGVRQLGRRLDALARKAAADVMRGGTGLRVRKTDVRPLLGAPSVDVELRHRRARIGVSMGLAYTSTGGALLPIEALSMPGTGRTTLTGQVGDVMRESFQTALSWARSRCSSLRLAPTHLDERDLHLHFPASAIPKEGPSAGIAIAVALYSLLARRTVRNDVALTGELSLHGAVLPVGGLREKLLAAARAGLREVIVPAGNGEELLRLPREVRDPLEIHLVARIDEVLERALMPPRSRGRAGGRNDVRGGGPRPRAARPR